MFYIFLSGYNWDPWLPIKHTAKTDQTVQKQIDLCLCRGLMCFCRFCQPLAHFILAITCSTDHHLKEEMQSLESS